MERQKGEFVSILDELQQAGVNTVLLQARVRATTIYPSSLEPWDGCMSGQPGKSPGYDPLAFAIEECHKRGMELHAWVVTIPVGKWNGKGCSMLRKRYPKLLRRIGDDGFMNPENSLTGDYLARICTEITKNYDVDGIHLDYIRYPESWNIRIGRDDARRYITSIVQKIHAAVKGVKPWVKMSCSPIGKYDNLSRFSSYGWNAYTKVCQDAQGWLRSGLMDQIYPMMYFRGNQFFPFAIDWSENSCGRTVVPGLGIYFLHPSEKDWQLDTITREMEVLRNHGMGHAFFRSRFLTDNVKGIYDFVTETFDNTLALIPPMTWYDKPRPSAPSFLTVKDKGLVKEISWGKARDNSRSPYLTYNLYASYSSPVDVSDANNLVATRLQGNSIIVDSNPQIYYAVTAMDRYGNESTPIGENWNMNVFHNKATLLENDGRTMKLPSFTDALDANYILFESINGQIVATQAYSPTVDIEALPNGCYFVRTVNNKGISHRLGQLIVKWR